MHVTIRPLVARDLADADRIFRLAFGTFLGLPDPSAFMGDADVIRTRWRMMPHATLGAFHDDALVGSNIATQWGSFGFFGPLSIRPDLWGRGIAQQLLSATMDIYRTSHTPRIGLFTFPNSPMHIQLYQKFGFWPRFLTPVMTKTVTAAPGSVAYSVYSALSEPERAACLADCRALTDSVEPGLDVTVEILSVAQQRLGDTVLIHEGQHLVGFAVCHLGPGSEAGSGSAYVKFGVAAGEAGTPRGFGRLLSACEALAAEHGLATLIAGVNTERQGACRVMIDAGFRAMMNGVAMMRRNEPNHNRPDCFVIDDWR